MHQIAVFINAFQVLYSLHMHKRLFQILMNFFMFLFFSWSLSWRGHCRTACYNSPVIIIHSSSFIMLFVKGCYIQLSSCNRPSPFVQAWDFLQPCNYRAWVNFFANINDFWILEARLCVRGRKSWMINRIRQKIKAIQNLVYFAFLNIFHIFCMQLIKCMFILI